MPRILNIAILLKAQVNISRMFHILQPETQMEFGRWRAGSKRGCFSPVPSFNTQTTARLAGPNKRVVRKSAQQTLRSCLVTKDAGVLRRANGKVRRVSGDR